MTPAQKSLRIQGIARDLGFDGVGIAPAAPVRRAEYLGQWLAEGRAGRMDYLHRHSQIRQDPRGLLPGAISVVVVAHNYYHPSPPRPDDRPRGRVAMYAWGRDYHQVICGKLHAVIDRMRRVFDEPFDARVCVDTAPLIERELAAAAGIGWIGKNTMVLNADLGSYFFLGEIVTTLDLAFDEPALDRCGRCTRCLDACPTGALDAPYRMDASRCISYLTIELRDPVPEELGAHMQDWVYGCDICQEVCPLNRRAPETSEPAYAIRDPGPHPLLADLLAWTQEDYDRMLRGSAMKRAKPHMLARNAAIAAANLARVGR